MKEGIFWTLLIIFISGLLGWGLPQWNVYRATLSGKAALQQAEQSKLIMIEDAKARLESAKLDAQAEIERAKGMSKAMEIENGQLTETYNQYLFIRTLEELAEQGSLPQIIYLPSQGMVPVMDLKK